MPAPNEFAPTGDEQWIPGQDIFDLKTGRPKEIIGGVGHNVPLHGASTVNPLYPLMDWGE
jgi:hypothetical protein